MFAKRIAVIVSFAQVAANFFVLIKSPPIRVQFFIHSPVIVNGTLTHDPGYDTAYQMSIEPFCVLASLLIAVFVTQSVQIVDSEDGTISSNAMYIDETVAMAGMWNHLFWGLVLLVHFILFACACTPVNLYALVLASYLSSKYLANICAPIDENRGNSVFNFDTLGYIGGVTVAACSVPLNYSARYMIILAVCACDYFLCIGHTWDRSPTFHTVAHSRMFWACAIGLSIVIAHTMWTDDFMVPQPTSQPIQIQRGGGGLS